MSDVTTAMNSETATNAVLTFTAAANKLETDLAESRATISNIQSQTESAWIKSYSSEFITFFDEGVTSVVSKIKDTAQKVGEISELIIAEDNNIQE